MRYDVSVIGLFILDTWAGPRRQRPQAFSDHVSTLPLCGL